MKIRTILAMAMAISPISVVKAQSNNTIRCQGIANTYYYGCLATYYDEQQCLIVQHAVYLDCVRGGL
jgi:hypothetical protein